MLHSAFLILKKYSVVLELFRLERKVERPVSKILDVNESNVAASNAYSTTNLKYLSQIYLKYCGQHNKYYFITLLYMQY